jgi:hypothetical protein
VSLKKRNPASVDDKWPQWKAAPLRQEPEWSWASNAKVQKEVGRLQQQLLAASAPVARQNVLARESAGVLMG